MVLEQLHRTQQFVTRSGSSDVPFQWVGRPWSKSITNNILTGNPVSILCFLGIQL